MFSLGTLTFLSPWLLSALAVVPVIWWLLRVLPPRPKQIKFPAFFILKELKADIQTAAKTPWWLLLLRSIMLVCLILAFADPVERLNDKLPGTGGAVLIVVDNDWSAASQWKARQDKIKEILPRIKRSGRSVVFLPTAPAREDGHIRPQGPMDIADAKKWAERFEPQPWQADHQKTLEQAVTLFDKTTVSYTLFLSNGLNQKATKDLLKTLQSSGGGLTVVADAEVNNPHILTRQKPDSGSFVFRLKRLMIAPEDKEMQLVAYAAEGEGVLDRMSASFPAGKTWMDMSWDMPPDLRRKVGRITLQNRVMASTTYLTDSRWRQKPVGIIADDARREERSFLNEIYYLRRALEVGGNLAVDPLDVLMENKLSVIVWPDSAPLTAVDRVKLLEWVQAGGFLIRFAGPVLAANPEDPLLPVALRYGQRALEGAMTWEKPVKLGGMPEESPLFGLEVPEDVTVTRQVLADPTPESFEKTWLQLADGTPLITGSAMDNGFIALIHTTAGPEWSDFAYSGIYVSALQRMVALSTGIGNYKGESLLPPLMMMDGFGTLYAPEDKSIVLSIDPKNDFTPSPKTPPGMYGDSRQFQVFNLGRYLPEMKKLSSIPVAAVEENYNLSGEESMKPDFLKITVILLLIETVLTLWLRGLLALPRFKSVAGCFLVCLLLSSPASAEGKSVTDLTTGIYLAYVETGDVDVDRTSYNGLEGLAKMIKRRTTIDIKGVRGVNLASDKLAWYPFIYWPMTQGQQRVSSRAVRNLQSYLTEGGMVVFDTRDQQFAGANTATIGTKMLRNVTNGLQIPELMQVGPGHILTKSFYLLDDFPGRFAGGKLWVEKMPSAGHDGVTSVIIGANDWAAAWSADSRDRARFDITPGGERQREIAYRFGVNLAMTALAGNYKSDQVHVPYILERMKK